MKVTEITAAIVIVLIIAVVALLVIMMTIKHFLMILVTVSV